jgi:hypothetical protein
MCRGPSPHRPERNRSFGSFRTAAVPGSRAVLRFVPRRPSAPFPPRGHRPRIAPNWVRFVGAATRNWVRFGRGVPLLWFVPRRPEPMANLTRFPQRPVRFVPDRRLVAATMSQPSQCPVRFVPNREQPGIEHPGSGRLRFVPRRRDVPRKTSSPTSELRPELGSFCAAVTLEVGGFRPAPTRRFAFPRPPIADPCHPPVSEPNRSVGSFRAGARPASTTERVLIASACRSRLIAPGRSPSHQRNAPARAFRAENGGSPWLAPRVGTRVPAL